MKQKNKFNMYSGGYIFDCLDRAALNFVMQKSGLPKKTVVVTAEAHINFLKQLCDKYNMSLYCDNFRQIGDNFQCIAELIGPLGEVYARAHFTFKTATNHCEVK